jgi:hypothetical protein
VRLDTVHVRLDTVPAKRACAGLLFHPTSGTTAHAERWFGSAHVVAETRTKHSLHNRFSNTGGEGMLKKFMLTTALTGLMIGGAAAQTTTVPSGVNQPERAANSSATFINAQNTDQWLSSNFIGVDVIGPDNEKIGDVADILFEKNGNVVGYVVGVGGFLGIGAKNVALAPSSFTVVPANADRSTTGSASSTASADDVKLKLNMTKDQLQQAASFESKREQDAKARAAAQPGGGMNRPAPK